MGSCSGGPRGASELAVARVLPAGRGVEIESGLGFCTFQVCPVLLRQMQPAALALVSFLLLAQAAVRGSAVLTRTTNAGGSPAKVRRRGPPPLTASVTFAPSFKAAYRARGSAPLTATKGPLLHEYVVSAGTPRHELSAMLHGLSGSGQVETASQLLQHALEVDPRARTQP